MFQDLTQKLNTVFKKLRGQGKISESNITDSLREIRRSLLEADVNVLVVKNLIQAVQDKAIGQKVLESITAGQQIIKIFHDELVRLLGLGVSEPVLEAPPHITMLVGLQGSGKTTTCGKLARFYQKKGLNPLLVAADIYRPAAVKQLQVLGDSLNCPVFSLDNSKPEDICFAAIEYARKNNRHPLILDTAGRLHIDTVLMQELERIIAKCKPHHVFFVADAMTGQDAVNVAKSFHEQIHFNGVILTKMDGDARGGAALSILTVTGKPVLYITLGEKLDSLEPFHPDRLASRILGMGDIVSLVEKAQDHFDQQVAEKLEQKLRQNTFDLEDFLNQLQQLKKMGPLENLLSLLPGMNSGLKNIQLDEKALTRVEAQIQSMTPAERSKPDMLNNSRKKRISSGSGTSIQELNRLLKQFEQMRHMIKNMNKMPGLKAAKLSLGKAGGFL